MHEHDNDQEDEGQEILAETGERIGDRGAHHIDVDGEPGQQTAGGGAVEEAKLHPAQMCI